MRTLKATKESHRPKEFLKSSPIKGFVNSRYICEDDLGDISKAMILYFETIYSKLINITYLQVSER